MAWHASLWIKMNLPLDDQHPPAQTEIWISICISGKMGIQNHNLNPNIAPGSSPCTYPKDNHNLLYAKSTTLCKLLKTIIISWIWQSGYPKVGKWVLEYAITQAYHWYNHKYSHTPYNLYRRLCIHCNTSTCPSKMTSYHHYVRYIHEKYVECPSKGHIISI